VSVLNRIENGRRRHVVRAQFVGWLLLVAFAALGHFRLEQEIAATADLRFGQVTALCNHVTFLERELLIDGTITADQLAQVGPPPLDCTRLKARP
jgi:hypothetical protein